AIQQLDRVTQQNTSAAEEMSATAEELSSQAEQLQAAIAYFRLNEQAEQVQRAALSAAVKVTASRPRQEEIIGREEVDGGFSKRNERDAWDIELKHRESA
ncbi:hypothetical protein ACUY1T_15625, partial [Billgrantia sp. Q4P2]